MKLVLGILVLATAGYFGSKAYLHHEVGESVDQAVVMMSPYVAVEYDGISSTMTGELTVDGVRATVKGFADPITIDSIGIDTPSYLSLLRLTDLRNGGKSGAPDIPDELAFIVEGLRVATDSDVYRTLHQFRLDMLDAGDGSEPAAECVGKYGFSPAALLAMGYGEQVVSSAFRFRNTDTHFAVEVDGETRDMWRFAMGVEFDGNLLTGFAQGAGYRPAMRRMRLEYNDLSLNGRIEKYCRSLGLSDDDILQAHLDSLGSMGADYGIVFDEYVVDPYVEFLGGKSTIVFKAEPSAPIRMSQLALYKPEDVPALLNLSAEAL